MHNDDLKKELERIRQQSSGGLLKEEDIVVDAQPINSPLHGEFEWDNAIAGDKYRLMQATNLIHRVSVTIATPQGSETVRYFVSLSSDRLSGGGFRSVVDVLSNAQQQQELLDTALAELQNFQNRYKTLTALSGVFQAIKTAVQKRTRTGQSQKSAHP